MRKKRLIFWIISFIICTIVIVIYKREENKIPYEKRQAINVYCSIDELKDEIKDMFEDSSIGDTHRVVFTEKEEKAEFILTDEITSADTDYKKVGSSPLVVAFGEDKLKSYKKDGYFSENDDCYIVKFNKIINKVIKKEWKGKIYCPKLKSKEGELFFDFLLANVNGGEYPRNETEISKATEKAKKFLDSDCIIEVDTIENLKNRKTLKNELYIMFENDILSQFQSNKYDFDIAYPSNTINHDWYTKYNDDLKGVIEEVKWYESGNNLEVILSSNEIRNESDSSFESEFYKISEAIPVVSIPLKE